jgi:hypothetical protein
MKTNGDEKYWLRVYVLHFEGRVAHRSLPKGSDVIDVSALSDGSIALHVIEPIEVERMDPREFYLARSSEPVPVSVGKGDYVGWVYQDGHFTYIFAGQYDRGIMAKEMPAKHRAITKQAVLAND